MRTFRYKPTRGGEERPWGYPLVLLAVGMLVCMMAAVVISTRASDRAIREAERGQCDTIASDILAYQEVPPTTPAGWYQLRVKEARFKALGCPVPDGK